MTENASLIGLLSSLVQGFVDNLRKNKIATALSAIALVVFTILAFSSQYDERVRYRQVLLPDITEAEARFKRSMQDAVSTVNDEIRIHHFLHAHRMASRALNVINGRWPQTRQGQRAHRQLVRYYE